MISALSRPLSFSLHLIISPNIITYSEALKTQPIPWHSKIHQESASSLKNLIKYAQTKHTEMYTQTELHTHTHKLIQDFWEVLPCGAYKFLFALIKQKVLSGCRMETLSPQKALCLNKLNFSVCLEKLCGPQPVSNVWSFWSLAELRTLTLCHQVSHTLIIFPSGIQLWNYLHLVAMLVACFWWKSLAKKECFSIASK